MLLHWTSGYLFSAINLIPWNSRRVAFTWLIHSSPTQHHSRSKTLCRKTSNLFQWHVYPSCKYLYVVWQELAILIARIYVYRIVQDTAASAGSRAVHRVALIQRRLTLTSRMVNISTSCFDHESLCILYSCVLYDFRLKRRLSPWTALTSWSL
jgi:hypothetical protein